MSFLDDIESDAAMILGSEFSSSGVLKTPDNSTLNITVIFDQNTVDVDTEGNMIISEKSQGMIYLKPIDTFLGFELTENSGCSITLNAIIYKIKEVTRHDSNTGTISFKL